MRIVYGNLLELAKEGKFDVITHSCNCFCRMKRGIAPLLAKEFGCDKFPLEDFEEEGMMEKLGRIDFKVLSSGLIVINSYMQYHWKDPSKYGFPFDYDACRLCLRKINFNTRDYGQSRVGLPMIGCGFAGANPDVVLSIIEQELVDCDTTVVILPKDKSKFSETIERFERTRRYDPRS